MSIRTYKGVRYWTRAGKGDRFWATSGKPSGWTTCGTCGRAWDDSKSTSLTPTPGGRCPFEHWHKAEKDQNKILVTIVGEKVTLQINGQPARIKHLKMSYAAIDSSGGTASASFEV